MLELLWNCSVGDGHIGQLHLFDNGNAYAVLDWTLGLKNSGFAKYGPKQGLLPQAVISVQELRRRRCRRSYRKLVFNPE